MARRRSRVIFLVGLVGAGVGVYWWRRTRVLDADLIDAPSWPPLDVSPAPAPPAPEREPAPAGNGTTATDDVADSVATWVVPGGDGCPDGHPVKATKTGVYHVPGGQFYERASAERCYATPAAAEADGYRASKR